MNNFVSTAIALVYILFLPGFLFSFVFFRPDKIDLIERIALSFALSIAIVPLITFYLNLANVKISAGSITLEVLVLNLTAGIILLFKYIPTINNFQNKLYYQKHIHPVERIHATTNRKSVLNLHTISRELFQVSLITYLILLLTETIQEGFVSYFFDLNILLGIVLVAGILMILTNYRKKADWEQMRGWHKLMEHFKNKDKQISRKTLGKWDFYYILLISIGGGLLVSYKTSDLGTISLVVSLVTILIIFLLSYILFTEQD